jgi:hypothetical protein
MNTRGLMELVVLNIGYDLGILSPEILAMMVIMALVTTFMTGPALDLINFLFKKKTNLVIDELSKISKYKVLISFANPQKGKFLLRLAHFFVGKMDSNAAVTAMHIAPNNQLNQVNIDVYENNSFVPIVEESHVLNQKITTLFKVSNDAISEISDVANKGDYDLLIVGFGQSIFEGSLLGRILGFTTRIIDPDRIINTMTGKEKLFEKSAFEESTRIILEKTKVPVGILLDKNLEKADKVLVLLLDINDSYLINYAQKLISNAESQVTVLDVNGRIKNSEIKEAIRAIEQIAPNHIYLSTKSSEIAELIVKQDILIISQEAWKKVMKDQAEWLIDTPSILIISEPVNYYSNSF